VYEKQEINPLLTLTVHLITKHQRTYLQISFTELRPLLTKTSIKLFTEIYSNTFRVDVEQKYTTGVSILEFLGKLSINADVQECYTNSSTGH